VQTDPDPDIHVNKKKKKNSHVLQASPINMHVSWLENMCVLIDRSCSIYVIYNKASCLYVSILLAPVQENNFKDNKITKTATQAQQVHHNKIQRNNLKIFT
jgi:hypothetical protein